MQAESDPWNCGGSVFVDCLSVDFRRSHADGFSSQAVVAPEATEPVSSGDGWHANDGNFWYRAARYFGWLKYNNNVLSNVVITQFSSSPAMCKACSFILWSKHDRKTFFSLTNINFATVYSFQGVYLARVFTK